MKNVLPFFILIIAPNCQMKFIRFVERCPTRNERRILAPYSECALPEVYHCVLDHKRKPVETCNEYIQIPPGSYGRYTGISDKIYYVICPYDKYQPWPVKSYEIAECELHKSTCNIAGQELCDNGTTTSDVTCSCDFKNGFVNRETSRCFSPSDTESCYYNNSLETTKTGRNKSAIDLLNKTYTTTKESAHYKDRKIVFMDEGTQYFIAEATFIGILFFVNVGVDVYTILKKRYGRMSKCAMCSALTLVVIEVLCGFNIYIYQDKTSLKYHQVCLYILIILVCIGSVVVVCILYSYEILNELKWYNEDYEVRVFKLLNAAIKGDIPTLTGLADEGYIDMGYADYDQRTALHLAAYEGHVETVQYILNNIYCNKELPNRSKQDSEWHDQYVENNKLNDYRKIKDMIKNHQSHEDNNPNKRNARQKTVNTLIGAAESEDLEKLRRLQWNRIDMDLCDPEGRTALHAAAENGKISVVKYLLEDCGASPFARHKQKRPKDLVPDDRNNPTNKEIRELLEKTEEESLTSCVPGKVSRPDDDVQVVRLLNCSARGDIKRMKSFKKAGYNMKLSNYDKRTALHIAVSENQEHIVEFLLSECGFTVEEGKFENRWTKTPLKAALSAAMPVVQNIFAKYMKMSERRTFHLIKAAAEGDVTTLKSLHQKGMDMNVQNYDGRTALHLAATEGHLAAVQFLVNEAQVERTISDRENRSPVTDSKTNTIRDCIEWDCKKADTSSFKKISEVKEYMLHVMDAVSAGPLHILKDERFTYFSMDTSDYFKNTPLHVAAGVGNLKAVNYLINENVSPFARNCLMKTPLDLVTDKISDLNKAGCSYGKTEQSKFQLEQLNKIQEQLRTTMDEASTKSVEEDKNFVLYPEDERIFVFLNKAYKGDIKAIRRYLITDKTLLQKVDYDQRTALHLAAAEKHHRLVEFILDQNQANVYAKDRWKVTPMMEAEKSADDKMIKLFQKAINTNLTVK